MSRTPAYPDTSDVDIEEALEHLAEHGLPTLPAAPLIDVGTGAFLDYLEHEVLDGFVMRGGATCRLFEGPHGAGKSHLLTLIQHRCLHRDMAVVRATLSDALQLEDWKAITRYVLQRIELERDGRTYRGIARILEALRDSEGLATTRLAASRLPHGGFREAMLHQVSGVRRSAAASDHLRRFLHGERVRVGDLRKLGINGVKNPLSHRNAEQALATVLNGLSLLGVSGTVLLFDETEKAFRSPRATPSRKVRVSANLIRRLIDACATGDLQRTLVVFAVLPGFLSNCAEAYPALGQRLNMVRSHDTSAGWRSPVLPLPAVNSTDSPEAFLDEAVDLFGNLVTRCGGDGRRSRKAMRDAGQRILRSEASDGYRRTLIKDLALIAHQTVNGAAHVN
jgi:hypothetical protein